MMENALPHERRGFVHKRVGRLLGRGARLGASFIPGPGGGMARAIIGSIGGKDPRSKRDRVAVARTPQPESPDMVATRKHIAHGHSWSTPGHSGMKAFMEAASVPRARALGGDCPIPFQKVNPVTGKCEFFVGDQPGAEPGGVGGGQAVAGAFGMPAIMPDAEPITRLDCPAGMVLGRDNLCYPKEVLRRDSKFRKWRPGMRPILTGGERRGIAKARRSTNKARVAVGLAPLK